MAKNVFTLNSVHPDPLVIVGWIAFVLGTRLVCPTWAKLLLLMAARVLP